ncbi:MAG: hypothetical protein ACE5JR_03715 [Gemmatimonadota bacterium]
MRGSFNASSDRSSGRYRRTLVVGMLASVGLHAAVLALWRGDLWPFPFTVAAGPRAGDAVAAPGGGIMEVIRYAPLRQIEIPPPPATTPSLEVPEVETRIPQDRPLSAAARFGSLSSAPGPGLFGQQGLGDGGEDVAGKFRVTAPEPRVIIPEWNAPKEVKGMQVMVRVLVDRWGRPTGEVELRPITPNRKFNDRLVEKVLRMEYKPAYRYGRPVAAWAEMTFVF